MVGGKEGICANPQDEFASTTRPAQSFIAAKNICDCLLIVCGVHACQLFLALEYQRAFGFGDKRITNWPGKFSKRRALVSEFVKFHTSFCCPSTSKSSNVVA